MSWVSALTHSFAFADARQPSRLVNNSTSTPRTTTAGVCAKTKRKTGEWSRSAVWNHGMRV